MPPGTSDAQRDEYASIIKEISSDGAGVYPDGGEIHTVETSAANADAFSSRSEWCDKALVRRATGGLLTVLAESGCGTLAGSAHMEAFRQIAANDAISIAECINRQYVRRRIAAQFPGSESAGSGGCGREGNQKNCHQGRTSGGCRQSRKIFPEYRTWHGRR